MKERRSYPLKIQLNGRCLSWVLIDPHYEIRHSASISDDLILELVKLLDGGRRVVEAVTREGFEIICDEPIYWDGKAYRLILTLPPKNRLDLDYLGVINAHRVHERHRKR
jgi:hypothetical protein